MAEITPDYRVIAIDETCNWPEEITAITGRMAGVYVVNFAEETYCCSMTPAYWAEFLCNISEHYVREPEGYTGGEPYYDPEWASENLEDYYRSKALVAAWKGNFHGIAYEGANDASGYYERLNPDLGSKIDMASAGWTDEDTSDWTDEQKEKYRKERDDAAMEAAQYYMSNGEEWDDIAPWNRK